MDLMPTTESLAKIYIGKIYSDLYDMFIELVG